jgi:CheY-like chemotaxis protein
MTMSAGLTPASMSRPVPSHPHRVLVVEDEPTVRELVKEVLRDEGVQVEEARDGAEAIRALDERSPAVPLCAVLLDMMLPRVDGVRVLQHLAKRHADVPVVAMSASSEHLALAAAAGARTTVAKPFDLDRLLGAVTCYCQRGHRPDA